MTVLLSQSDLRPEADTQRPSPDKRTNSANRDTRTGRVGKGSAERVLPVLGIEAATPVASVGVATENGILAERMVNNKRTHSVNLLPMVRDVLGDAGVEPGNLRGIAISSGPGSFTGLRIGMAVAKTLAQVWDLPVVGISTLETLAQPLAGHRNLICPVLNARKNEVYTAVYLTIDEGIKCLAGPEALGINKLVLLLTRLLERHSENGEGNITFLGDGVPVYKEELQSSLGTRAKFTCSALWFPRGAVLAYLGSERIAAGEGVDPLSLQPEYVRLSEAEVKWQKKHGNTG